jgi:outer membrane receptor for ferrienterochelin and colicins
MSRSNYLLLFFMGLCCLPLRAQTRLSGQVLDALTREALPGAGVGLEGQSGIVFTDSLGCFSLPMSGAPMHLRVQMLGYQPWSGPAPQGPVLLLPADQNLGTVVISGAMKPVSKDQSAIPVEIYTPRFFQKNASASVFEALSGVNGVRPQLNCNICSAGDIHINGMEGPYTMITLDGMPIVSGLSTVYGLSGIPNGIIERVEIVKGPASTLYGSEAVGGLINIITKNPLDAPRLYADLFATSYGEYNLDASLSRRMGNAHSLLGVNLFQLGTRHDINRDGFTDMALQNRLSLFNKWSFRRKGAALGHLAGRYVYENRWGGQLQWAPEWRGTDSIYGENILTRRLELLGQYKIPLGSQALQLDASWNRHDQDSWYGTTLYFARQEVAFAQASTRWPWLKRHEILLGAALRYTVYDDNTPATAVPDGPGNQPARNWLPGIFVQNETRLGPKHTLLSGLRYDHHSAHGHILTPRLSWKYAPDAQHVWRLTAGSGYRVANIFTEDHAALTGAREVVIQEDLLPERSWNANLNWVRKFFPEKAGIIGLDASLFFTYFSNQILPDYATDPDKIIYANLNGYGISNGFSLNVDLSLLNGIKWIGGVTLMEVYRREAGQRLPQLFAPPFSGTWALTLPIGRRGLTLDYTGNLNSPMHLPVLPNDYRPGRSPWYSLHHLQLTQPLAQGRYELYLGLKNLFGFYPREDVIMRAFDPFDKQVAVDNPMGYTFDPSYNYAAIQGRLLLLGIRLRVR